MLSMFTNVGYSFSCILNFCESEVRADFLSVERSNRKRSKLFPYFLFYLRSAATKNMYERNVCYFLTFEISDSIFLLISSLT